METESRHVSVFVNRPADEVYRYAANPNNLPDWAAGLASGISEQDGRWFADSPMGRIEIKFAGEGCEVIFSVRRRGMTDAELDRDAAAVLADLQSLARILEPGG